MNKHTPLHSEHLAMGAKMCPFAGYDMPINYAMGVIKEHEWTRTRAGLFDVSHMGQALVTGAGAAEFLSRLTPSSFIKTPHGRAKYTVLTNDKGGIIDDLIITRMTDDSFFVVFNAGRKEEDIAWFRRHVPHGVSFAVMGDHALIALQGPQAESALMKELPAADLPNMPYMTMKEGRWRDAPVFVSRLGYTGEDGFEISIPENKAVEFWRALLANPDVAAIGLAARDSLRLEMGYPLYGHDLNEQTTPIEASLAWVMSKGHDAYIGADVLAAEMEAGARKKRIGIKLEGAGIAREGALLFVGDKQVGELTSGGFSPSLKLAIGQGYVTSDYAKPATKLEVEVRGKRIPASVQPLSFLPAKTKSSQLKKAS